MWSFYYLKKNPVHTCTISFVCPVTQWVCVHSVTQQGFLFRCVFSSQKTLFHYASTVQYLWIIKKIYYLFVDYFTLCFCLWCLQIFSKRHGWKTRPTWHWNRKTWILPIFAINGAFLLPKTHCTMDLSHTVSVPWLNPDPFKIQETLISCI